MRLTIFGASGGTGTCLVEQALSAGHEVTAVVRDPSRLTIPAQDRLHVRTASVLDPVAIDAVMSGADAVLTAIGPRGTGPTTIIEDSLASIVAAMQKAGLRRLLALSGSIVADEGESFYLRYLLKPLARRTFLRHVCADMRAGEAIVAASDLDWTIFRPPALTNGPLTGTYRTAVNRNLPRGFRVSRADLAAGLLARLGDPETVRKYVAIAA